MNEQERERRARRQSESAIAPGADPVEPRDPTARAVPRRSSTALLFAIPAVLLVLLGLGWMFLMERDAGDETTTAVEGTSGESAGGAAVSPELGATTGQPTTPAATSDNQMLANPEQYAGHIARLTAVPVMGTNGDRTFWAGRAGSRTLVLMDESITNPEGITIGQRVDLAGRFERTPSGDELQRLNLTSDDREAIQEAGVYLRATEVKVQGTIAAPESHTPQ